MLCTILCFAHDTLLAFRARQKSPESPNIVQGLFTIYFLSSGCYAESCCMQDRRQHSSCNKKLGQDKPDEEIASLQVILGIRYFFH